MAEDPREEPQGGRRAQLDERRERRRRELRRNRALAGAGLVVTVAAILAAIAFSIAGGSHSTRPGASRAAGESARAGAETGSGGAASGSGGPVRDATPQPGWKPHRGSVPILEYHVLGSPSAEAPYPELYVSRPVFHRQMDWLQEHGYEAVTLEQVEEAWYHAGTLPPRPVVLTFDDGYRPDFTYALPELRRHGWAGVLNLKAEGSDLYRSNVEAMIAAGWELASHTIDHSDLTTLEGAALRREVDGSRRLLEQEFGVPVKDFCYPAGQFDEAVIAAVEEAGYVTATTEIPGYASPQSPYELARFEILRSSGVAGVAEALESG